LPPLQSKLSEFNESHQPPLYYALVAIPISFVDTSDDVQPKFTAGGRTWVVADPQLDSFPYRGTALAIRLGRMVSVVLSTIAVALTYAIVRTALPGRQNVALLATAIHGLWPTFLFLGGTITNDVGMAVIGSITVLLVVHMWTSAAESSRRSYMAGLAASLACATLIKDSGIAIVLFGCLAIAGLMYRDLRARRYSRLADVAFFVVPLAVLIVLGGWVSDGRSFRQLNTTFAYGTHVVGTVMPTTPDASAPNQGGLGTLRSFVENAPDVAGVTLRTLFSAYSWGTLNIPDTWYYLAAAAGIIALAGLPLTIARKETRGFALLMLLCFGCVNLAPVIRGIYGGRFVLSGLSAFIALATTSLLSLPHLLRRAGATYALAMVGMVALMSPALVIAPAYQRPPLLDPNAPPEGIQIPTSLTFGGAIRLLGYSHPYNQTSRGEEAVITLYWRAIHTVVRDQGLRIELFSINGESFKLDYRATPGNNNFPTSSWKPGDTFAETYHIPIKLDAPAPTLATFKISWFDQQTNKTLESTCDSGAECEPKIGMLPVKLDPSSVTQWAGKPERYRLGQSIGLIDYRVPVSATAGQTLTVSLIWRAGAGGLGAQTTFVHLLSSDNKLVAQSDSPPRNGDYPTNTWSAGEVVPDSYSLPLAPTLPAGPYKLWIGMYDPKTLNRLPAFDATGMALADQVIPLQEVIIQGR
jgi:hypothetical protein